MARKKVNPSKEDLAKMALNNNPFINDNFQVRVRKRTDKHTFVQDGEEFVNKQFFQEIEQPTKLYFNPEIRLRIARLSAPAAALLLWIQCELEPGKEYVTINKNRYMAEHLHKTDQPIKEALFDLTRYLFITPTIINDTYWINPRILFNGSRIKKYHEFIKVIE